MQSRASSIPDTRVPEPRSLNQGPAAATLNSCERSCRGGLARRYERFSERAGTLMPIMLRNFHPSLNASLYVWPPRSHIVRDIEPQLDIQNKLGTTKLFMTLNVHGNLPSRSRTSSDIANDLPEKLLNILCALDFLPRSGSSESYAPTLCISLHLSI